MRAVAKYYDEITEFAKSKGREVPTPTETWIDFVASRKKKEAKAAAVEEEQPKKLLPTLIEFDKATGLPTNQQDVRVATAQQDKIAIVPWREWFGGRVAKTLDESSTHIAAIKLVLHSLHTRGSIEKATIDVSIDLDKKNVR